MEHTPRRSATVRVARWSATHPWRAIALWLAFVAACFAIGHAAGTRKATSLDQAVGQSGRAAHWLHDAKMDDPALEHVLISSRHGALDASAAARATADVRERLTALSGVAHVDATQHARNAVLVNVTMRGDPDTAQDRVQPLLDATSATQHEFPQLRVEEVGDASIPKAINTELGKSFGKATSISLPVTLLILLVAFGAIIAAGVPVLLALSAVAAAVGLSTVASHLVPDSGTTSSVILLMGMAVGVDYSLFYLKREREERARGRSHVDAIEVAARTSGHSVVVSGLAVIVAMAGMFLTRDVIFSSLAIGSILVIGVAVLGSLTVLPALLSKLGDRVEWGRLPFLGRNRESRIWRAVLRPALRYPKITVVGAVALLLAIAAPALHMHTRDDGVGEAPHNLPVVKAYDRVTKAFGTTSAPAVVVVHAPNIDSPAVRSGIAGLRRAVDRPVKEIRHADNTVELDVPLAGNGADATSLRALDTLRSQVIPSTIGAVPGATVAVTGETAGSADFTSTIDHHMPLILGFVFLLTLVLMLLCFRSLTVGLTAIGLNLLSVAAAYGAMTWVFQDGHGQGLLGFHSSGAIVPWVPLFLFAVLFGLSMDYHVFIVSRIRELVDRGYSTREAVDRGIRSTASTVTSAAMVMVGVFAVFATLGLLSLKQMGFGLAVAVLIDATVIRALLLPAVMTLLGERNWWLPRVFNRLPRLDLAAERA